MNNYFHEIKYFHPEGKTMPNSIYVHRGFLLNECIKNMNNFILTEGVCADQGSLSKYKGGIIVFSTDVNAVQTSENKLVNKIRQIVNTYKNRLLRGKIIGDTLKGKIIGDTLKSFNVTSRNEQVTNYTMGSSFKGSYLGQNGKIYNENSVSIEINGLSSESFLALAEILCKAINQECVLVKDLNKNKIYLADSIPVDAETNSKRLNTLNTE